MKNIAAYLMILFALSACGLRAQDWNHFEVMGTDTLFFRVDTVKATVVGHGNPVSGTITVPGQVTYDGAVFPVTEIGSRAFENCLRLCRINFPTSLTTIREYAFSGCATLGALYVPPTVTSVGSYAFKSVPYLEYDGPAVGAPWGANYYNSAYEEDGYYYTNRSKTQLICVDKSVDTFLVPSSVVKICDYAFAGTSLRHVSVEDTGIELSNHVFSYCPQLVSVRLNSQNATQEIFRGCDALTDIEILENVTKLKDGMFRECNGLKYVKVAANVETIDYDVFRDCSSLRTVEIGDRVEVILGQAFFGCTSLKNIYLGAKLKTIGAGVFSKCTSLEEVVLPARMVSVSSTAFYGCSNLSHVTCMSMNPPAEGPEEEDWMVMGMRMNVTVTVPCGRAQLYEEAWGSAYNYEEAPYAVVIASADERMGTVEIVHRPDCEDSTANVVATANENYRFDHWSDGSTENPYVGNFRPSSRVKGLIAYFVSTVGIDEVATSSPLLFPNPATDRLTLCLGAAKELQVFDMTGRQVAGWRRVGCNGEATVLDISGLRAGMYLVRSVGHDGSAAVGRFVKR